MTANKTHLSVSDCISLSIFLREKMKHWESKRGNAYEGQDEPAYNACEVRRAYFSKAYYETLDLIDNRIETIFGKVPE